MKYSDLIKAKPHLDELQKVDTSALPVTQRRALFGLCKAFANEVDFYSEQQRTLAEKYGKVTQDGTVQFSGATDTERASAAAPFISGVTELNNTEMGWQPDAIMLDGELLPTVTIEAMVALDGFITFFEEVT